jgi:hypothetical protein
MIELPKPKGEYRRKIKIQDVVNQVYDIVMLDISGCPTYMEKKFEIGFLERVCCLVEALCKKKYKADKKDIVYKVFQRIFNQFTDQDKKKIGEDIEHLHSRGLIKAVGTGKKLLRFALSFVKKSVSPTL